jgi:hypothetical protein
MDNVQYPPTPERFELAIARFHGSRVRQSRGGMGSRAGPLRDPQQYWY